MCLLYVDDVVLFATTLEDAQKLMRALEEFCMHTRLTVKIKMMLVKIQNKGKPRIMYKMSHLNLWIALITLVLKLLQITNGMNILATT